ncbi:MAG: PTS fructose transporter subunit IIA [Lachnospiraceae bacterium]|nr:PTS fructose transporter subunit IIA [Lachnospiraceae bacterium]
MVQLIVVSHGSFSKALLESAQLIVGEQKDIQTFGFDLGESIDELRDKLGQAIETAQKKGEVLVLTDMLSGSPFNAAASLMQRFSFEHLAGINFPVFLEILTSREDSTARDLVATAVSRGKDTIVDVNQYIEEVV